MSDANDSNKTRKERKGSSTAGYVGAIIVNLILLFIFNNLLNWGAPFLTQEFVVPLRILNISIIATIVVNFVFLLYNPDWFLAITRTALNIIGVVVVYTFYITFPFDFSPLANEELIATIVRILLILGIVGATIGVIAEFSKFIKAITGANRP